MNSTGRVWARIRRIAASDRISGLIMLAFAFAGLVLANLPWTSHMFEAVAETQLGIPGTNIILPIGHWAQDGLLTIFFLTVGLDLKQELTTGSLANPKAAAVPMLCAVGGMLMPPVLFITVISLFSRFAPPAPGIVTIPTGADVPFAEAAQGWAIPTATDIAFSLAVLALFAKALPGSIRAFLMTLATVDDLLAIILIAVFFSSLNAWYWFIGIAICAAIWAFLVRLRRVPWLLVAVIGVLAWVMMFEAGVHPTLAGVLVGLLTPSREMHSEKSPRAQRYASKLQPFSSLLALPIFALFATGVHFAELSPALMLSPVVIGIIVALVIGKPLGIMITAWLSTHVAGLTMAKGLRVRQRLHGIVPDRLSGLHEHRAVCGRTVRRADGIPDRGAHQRHPPEPSVQAVREGGAGVGVVTELLLVCWRHPRQGVRDHVENGCVEEKRQEKEAA